MSRIAWGPGGNAVLICRDGTVALHAVDGRVIRELAVREAYSPSSDGPAAVPVARVLRDYLDARWLSDGRIVAVDRFGQPITFTMHGDPYDDSLSTPMWSWNPRSFASIAANGTAFVAMAPAVSIHTTATNQTLWTLVGFERYAKRRVGTPLTAALSPDARRIAIATETRGRQWIVLDIAPTKNPNAFWSAAIVDQEVIADDAIIPRCALANGGRRITNRDGETALAIDASEIRTARAYLPGARQATLRVDYTDGETVWIEPGIGELVALAFGPDDRIACLAANGTFEIVPVP